MGRLLPPNSPAFTMLRSQVVLAKPIRPRGAGLASLVSTISSRRGCYGTGTIVVPRRAQVNVRALGAQLPAVGWVAQPLSKG